MKSGSMGRFALLLLHLVPWFVAPQLLVLCALNLHAVEVYVAEGWVLVSKEGRITLLGGLDIGRQFMSRWTRDLTSFVFFSCEDACAVQKIH